MRLPGAVLLCLLSASVAGGAKAQKMITYRVEPRPADKTYRVQLDIPRVKELTVRVQMPVWMPGAYFVGNFATNVSEFSAMDSRKRPLRVFHPDPNTWEISANGAGAVTAVYTVRNADIELSGSTARRAHISGPQTYMYVVGRKAEPAELDLVTPAGAAVWHIVNSLDPLGAAGDHAAAGDVTRFRAPTYDVLADAPVEMGDFAEERFTAGRKPHSVIIYGDYTKVDRAKLTDICKRVAEVETGFFGDAPYGRYVFEFRATSAPSRGAGGLEHLGSTEIGVISDITDSLRFVIAHEYFHLWNVKRIRPFVLGPFNYVDPPHTANLWWSEGVTSYYADLLSVRGALTTRPEYLTHLGKTIAELQNNPARLKVSADEASLRVWEANNSSGYNLSYYTKGELVGLCLDLKIRSVTGGRYSLDDVIKALYSQVRHGEGPGFEEDDIKKTVNRISGHDLSEFYDTVARSTEELPFGECLGYVGLRLAPVEPAKTEGDTGMRLRFDRTIQGIGVAEVTPGGAADTAGLKAGDTIKSANTASDGRAMFGIINGAKPGDRIHVTVSRSGRDMDIDFQVGSRSVYSWEVTPDPAASTEQTRLRDQWLQSH